MQNKTLTLLLAVIVLLLSACQGQKEQPAVNFDVDNNFYMLRGDTLPQAVDLTQDISTLNYQNLRLLRSYVYAIHGHWFMEGDLNRFFANHTRWYEEYCYLQIEERPYEEGIDPEERERIEAYATALWQDYPKSYDLITLTDEERTFVQKIDRRMAELMETKEYAGQDQALLLNPNLMVNWFQMSDADPLLKQRLVESNVAFGRTQLEQLFQVYEENDYHMMPNFITTDVMLQAYHMYFSYVLTSLERHVFSQHLVNLFKQLYAINQQVSREATTDENVIRCTMRTYAYCAVALRLLGQEVIVPEQMQGVVAEELKLIQGEQDNFSPLFQTDVYFNYSLFRPRGHYTRTEADKRYFRAMMWLQKGCFYREKEDQMQWAVYLAQLIRMMPSDAQTELHRLNEALSFMMGEPDNLSLIEMSQQLQDLAVSNMQAAMQPQTLAALHEWFTQASQGRNRITPRQAIGPQEQLNLMPQRYTVDGNILGCLFDDEVNAERAYPKGLDVFAILGVKSAKALLDTCYHTQQQWTGYKQQFDSLSKVMKGFDGWNKSFYNKWMENLVVLQKQSNQQPGFMQTSTWQLKNLNTGLASWALLKHDAILYAEQPMAAECGGGGLPDPTQVGYVEPNVPFWKKLKETVELNETMLRKNDFLTEDIEDKTQQLAEFINFCLRISEQEIAGEKISAEDFGTIKAFGASMEYFTLSVLDPDKQIYEWSLVEGADRSIAQVADVFTRNILGCEKDGILYEASGTPNEIYVVVEINGQCYLTRGATYSYYEFVRPLSQPRLTDEEWQQMLQDENTTPPTTEWFAPMLMDKPGKADERYVYSTGC